MNKEPRAVDKRTRNRSRIDFGQEAGHLASEPGLRILHLVHQYPPDHLGGTELYTQTVARALSERNHSVAVFTRRNDEGIGHSIQQEAQVSVNVAWNGRLSPIQRFLATFGNAGLEDTFTQVLDQFRPDLVHIQHLMGLPISLVDCIRRREIPIIITLHDFWWVCANAQLVTNYSGEICDGPSLWLNCSRCALARSGNRALWPAVPVLPLMLARRGIKLQNLLNQADSLIAPSQFVKDWYVEHGVQADSLHVLPHGIEQPPPAGQKFASENKVTRFFYAGGLAWQKGVHVLLEAFTAVEGDCELWIAGDEGADPEYSRRLRELASPGGRPSSRARVCFLGKLSRRELWARLAQVDAVVVPALWYETFSLIVHEAFSAGCPVIASDLGALREAIEDERNGLLVEAGNVAVWQRTLQELVNAPEKLQALQKHVRTPVSLDEHVSRLQILYSDVIRQHVGV